MNAAFLLLTTAWVAGADAAPAAAPAVTSTSSCDSACCDKPSLLDKLRAKFAKDCCDAPKCEAPKVVKCEKKADPCDPCKVSILDKLRAKLAKDCCDAPKCEAPKVVKCEKKADPCDPCKVSLLDKLRAKLHKNDCCEVVAPESAPKAAPKGAEKLPAGKSASIVPVPTISEVNAF